MVVMLYSFAHLRVTEAPVANNPFYRHIFPYIKPYLHVVRIMTHVLWDVVAILQSLFYFTDSSKQPCSRNKMEDPWQKAYDFAVAVAKKAGEVQFVTLFFFFRHSNNKSPNS